MILRSPFSWWLTGLLCLLLPSGASSHTLNYGASETLFQIHSTTISFTTTVPLYQDTHFEGDDHWRTVFQNLFQQNLSVDDGQGWTCPLSLTGIENTSRPGHTTFQGVLRCPTPIAEKQTLHIRNTLFASDFQRYDNYVTISFGYFSHSLAFNQTHTDERIQTSILRSDSFWINELAIVWAFIKLGIEHILTGYDHILFLLSTILLLRSLKSILILVTAFTAAHSITLILASLSVITAPPSVVEPLIALTIASLAAKDWWLLHTRQASEKLPSAQSQWLIVFAFGLIHGLGFASALGETDIPHGQLAPALVAFNIGIELGQVFVLALVLPLLWRVDQLQSRTLILKTFSGAVLLLALLWFSVRVFLGDECSTVIHFWFLQFLCI